MTTIRALLPILLSVTVTFSAVPASAQSARLVYRWSPGEPLRYETTESMHQTISGPIESELKWQRRITYTESLVAESDAGTRIERAFERVGITVSRDGEPPVRYDSATPDLAAARSPMIGPFVGFVGKSIRFTIADDGTVSDVEGAAETLDAAFTPLESISSLKPGLSGARQDPTRGPRIARQIEQAMGVIPGRTVHRGQRWPVEIDHASPLAGDLSSDLIATFDGIDTAGGAAKILLEGTLSLTPPGDEGAGFASLLGITLESGAISGQIRFDEEKGHIKTSKMQLKTVWTVGGGLAGGESPMRQTIDQHAELKRLP